MRPTPAPIRSIEQLAGEGHEEHRRPRPRRALEEDHRLRADLGRLRHRCREGAFDRLRRSGSGCRRGHRGRLR